MIGAISSPAQSVGLRRFIVRSLLDDTDPSDLALASTLAFVDERLARMRGAARLALLTVERLLSAALVLTAAGPCASPRRTEAMLRRVVATTLPGAAEYVRLVRSLALIYIYETSPPGGKGPE